METTNALMAVVAALSLAGCASVVPHYDIPNDPRSGEPTVRSIVDEITCELDSMLDDHHYRPYLLGGDMVAAFQLNLTVNDSGGLAPTMAFSNGLFSFGVGASLSQSREQNYTETLYYSMKELDSDNQAARKNGQVIDCRHVIDTNLAGDLGLREAVAMAIQSPHLKTDQPLSGSSGEFGGYINFGVTKNLNSVGPTWTLTHFRGPGGLMGVSEVNTDKLQFAFAQAAPAPAAPAKSAAAKGTGVGLAKYKTVINQLQNITLNQIATQLVVNNNR
jgi:hypothetical protein